MRVHSPKTTVEKKSVYAATFLSWLHRTNCQSVTEPPLHVSAAQINSLPFRCVQSIVRCIRIGKASENLRDIVLSICTDEFFFCYFPDMCLPIIPENDRRVYWSGKLSENKQGSASTQIAGSPYSGGWSAKFDVLVSVQMHPLANLPALGCVDRGRLVISFFVLKLFFFASLESVTVCSNRCTRNLLSPSSCAGDATLGVQ